MGLLQNGYRHNLTRNIFGATALDGANPSVHVYRGHRTAANRNQLAGEAITDDLAAVPNGNLAPSAWILPRKGGGMSARLSQLTLTATASGVMGFPISGESSFTLDFAVADGQLISSGTGSATITIDTNTPSLTASIGGTGEASFAITPTALLGAEASAEGSVTFTFAATAVMLPTDDTSPLREGTATLSITGALTPYAIGQMIGSTADATVLTVDAIAAAVLAAALTAPIHANIQYVNDVEVTGDGQTGTEWGPV